jgi:flagellar biosynthetic protein FlhB
MSTSSSPGDKQEKPTPKRLKDAKEKGQVARSRELGAAIGLCGAALGLAWVGVRLTQAMATRMAGSLATLDRHAGATVSHAELTGLVFDSTRWFSVSLAPLTGLVLVAVAAGFAVQGGVTFAPKALKLHWDRLGFSHGMSRFKPSKSGADVVRACLALTVVALLTVPVLQDLLARAPELVVVSSNEAAGVAWQALWRLLWRGALALLILGAADFLWQRWTWTRGLRMSRQEVRDELKQQEGSPEVRARIRRIQREMVRSRMLAQVKTATVVLTNPTHYAVALAYQKGQMAAPIVVAKGADAIAARIRALAREAGVPIIENPSLARALHANAELGDPIPATLFTAVAEVLAYLVRIRQLVL